MRGRIIGMNESEARAKARAVIFAKTGVNTDPDSTVFKNIGGRRAWKAFYGPQHFYPEIVAEGGVVDGGEYIVIVDDRTGQASVLGEFRGKN